MHAAIEAQLPAISELCRRYDIRSLSLFGSAIGDRFDEATSDIDVVVEFRGGPDVDYFESYFGLKEGLEALFGRPADVVTLASIKNPYFRAEVERTRQELYAA